MNKLTPKQEKFALKYVELSNASEAYRQSYNAENMQDTTIWTEACLLLGDQKVAKRVEELKLEIKNKALCTIEELNEELKYARDLADKQDDYRELRANAMDRGKLNGIIIDKKELAGKDGKDLVNHITVVYEDVIDD